MDAHLWRSALSGHSPALYLWQHPYRRGPIFREMAGVEPSLCSLSRGNGLKRPVNSRRLAGSDHNLDLDHRLHNYRLFGAQSELAVRSRRETVFTLAKAIQRMASWKCRIACQRASTVARPQSIRVAHPSRTSARPPRVDHPARG